MSFEGFRLAHTYVILAPARLKQASNHHSMTPDPAPNGDRGELPEMNSWIAWFPVGLGPGFCFMLGHLRSHFSPPNPCRGGSGSWYSLLVMLIYLLCLCSILLRVLCLCLLYCLLLTYAGQLTLETTLYFHVFTDTWIYLFECILICNSMSFDRRERAENRNIVFTRFSL